MVSEYSLESIINWTRSRRAAVLVIIIITLLLIFNIYRIVNLLFLSKPKPPIVRFTPIAVPTQADIAAWHLFGDYATAVREKVIPLTRLNLTLEGILFSTVPSKSQVLISSPGQPVRAYKITQKTPQGAIVKKILENRVILEYGGQLQTLPLKIPQLQFGPAPKDKLSKPGNQ